MFASRNLILRLLPSWGLQRDYKNKTQTFLIVKIVNKIEFELFLFYRTAVRELILTSSMSFVNVSTKLVK